MENNDLTPKQQSQFDWRLLDQSELSNDAASNKLPQNWLCQILEPFNLPTNLANKLKTSLGEAISHSSRLEVRIYTPKDVQADLSSNKNWGFFKLEKVGTNTKTEEPAELVIEYYLYLEK